MGMCAWSTAAWAVMVWNSWPSISAIWAWACAWTVVWPWNLLTLLTFLTQTTRASRKQFVISLNVISIGKCFHVIEVVTFSSELCYLTLMMTNKKWNNYILFYCLVLFYCLLFFIVINSVLFMYLLCISNNSFSAEENLSLMIIIRWLLMLF